MQRTFFFNRTGPIGTKPARSSHRGPRVPSHVAAASPSGFPSFFPPLIEEVVEETARSMAKGMTRVPVPVPFDTEPIDTAFVGPSANMGPSYPAPIPQGGSPNPLVLLHGFDSSSLEFRRFFPRVRTAIETYALCVFGNGFTSNGQRGNMVGPPTGPLERRHHLYAFQQEVLKGRKMVLLGASLGGAMAIDFAFHHPDSVEKIVLVDGQGFIDGIGPMRNLPVPLARLGVQVLGSDWLRQMAGEMSYSDKSLASPDARLISAIHLKMPYAEDATVRFMKSGGYPSAEPLLPYIQTPTLVVWGKEDKILDPKYAYDFQRLLPNAHVEIIENCGHVAHLEQPKALTQLVADFVGVSVPADVKGMPVKA